MTIISGTGRSGTKLIHAVLSQLGASVGFHEIETGKDGGVGGYRVLNRLIPDSIDYKIFNQVRHPLEVVRSSFSSKNMIDYPELNAIYKEYSCNEEYLMNLWLKINSNLCSRSHLSYTLEQLNNGAVTSKLIEAFNLNCSEADFNNEILKVKADSIKNNTRKNSKGYGSHVTENLLREIDSEVYEECLLLYDKINL
jgi:hypothetical protein